MVSVPVSLKLNANWKKKILLDTVSENRYPPELNENEIGLLANATPGIRNKATYKVLHENIWR